jgi:hypothetical protein
MSGFSMTYGQIERFWILWREVGRSQALWYAEGIFSAAHNGTICFGVTVFLRELADALEGKAEKGKPNA